MSSTTPGDEKDQSDPLALIFIHILTYLEEELAWRHWERLLRAISTCAIFTVSLYKKVLDQDVSTLWSPGDPGSLNFHQRHPSYQLLIPFLCCPLCDARFLTSLFLSVQSETQEWQSLNEWQTLYFQLRHQLLRQTPKKSIATSPQLGKY